ncbi:MAG: hypothetical protein ACEQSQ_00105 [Candidatus Paceibacteria bacterium]
MKKVKQLIRKEIQSLYELAELTKGKKAKEIYAAIWHLNNAVQHKKKK